jgi:hypothetical protein
VAVGFGGGAGVIQTQTNPERNSSLIFIVFRIWPINFVSTEVENTSYITESDLFDKIHL